MLKIKIFQRLILIWHSNCFNGKQEKIILLKFKNFFLMRLNWAGQCFVRSCFLGYVILFPARAKLFNNRETDFFSLAHIFSYCYQQSISHKTSSFVYSKSVETVSHCVSVCMCVFVCVCAHACMTFWNQSKKKGCREGDLIHRFVEKCKSNLNSSWVLCLAFRTLKKWRNEFMKKNFFHVSHMHIFLLGK